MNYKFVLEAPAKINLTLEVLGKREDGYHEIRSIMQTISLSDKLTFSQADKTRIEANVVGWNADKSLISKTVEYVKEKTGCRKEVSISLEKNIPLVSGLGGDSSDAAAVIKGLNQCWEMHLTENEMLSLATGISSDVSFFIHGGMALATGRGEEIFPLAYQIPGWLLIFTPELPVINNKTRTMYSHVTMKDYTNGEKAEEFINDLSAGKELINDRLFNCFQTIALKSIPGLQLFWDAVITYGMKDLQLCGSGPAFYALVQNESEARVLKSKIKIDNLYVYTAGMVRAS